LLTKKAGSSLPELIPPARHLPLWLLAELTYACPLQCAYCSNPLDYPATRSQELGTDDWLRVMAEARALGAAQIGFSGGEPLLRQDLEILVEGARKLGFYTNLITSTVGMDAERMARLREVGLDHIQVSFQGAERDINDYYAANQSFEHKLAMAREVKRNGLPMVLNFVLHRDNIDQVEAMLELSLALQADYVELANCQYYGWALLNRKRLLPSREQVQRAKAVTERFREQRAGKMKLYFVLPDYYENRPKACANGWGTTFLTISPEGTALPCQSAKVLPGLAFPSVRDHSVEWIWQHSPLFNRFRGDTWMKEPCRSCPEKARDFGGCRCQAYLLTGDAENADPVCDLSPEHDLVLTALDDAHNADDEQALIFRNPQNARQLTS
jgi:pyrroloquinoline quinone biosynthesis protein E